MMIETFFPGILGFIVLYHSISFLKLLFRNLLLPTFFSKRKDIKNYGNWVVITGATDGIGKAFAELLAKEGFNLVLISRTEQKLQDFKNDLLSKYKSIEIVLIAADFTKADIYEMIEEKIAGLEVALLINNVGASYTFPSSLVDDYVSNEFASNLINCNCLSMILMSKLILKAGMLKKGGIIINVSSGMSIVPAPFLSIYGASKSFANSFTLSCQSEFKDSKVIIQNVSPLLVSTKMSRVRPSLFAPSAMSFANSVLDRIGTCSLTNGCFVHELQGWFLSLVPQFIIEKVLYSSLSSLRQRALRKNAKQQ